jgi:hypothetical protein
VICHRYALRGLVVSAHAAALLPTYSWFSQQLVVAGAGSRSRQCLVIKHEGELN